MRLQRRPHEEPEVNLTSLIDVVFLLLLFFMVSTTFERRAALRIDLPEASVESQTQAAPRQLELVIDAAGRMYLGDRQLVDSAPQTLEAAFSEAAGSERGLPVILRADAQTPHHYVVTAMDVIGRMGFSQLSIATERPANSD